REYGERSVKFAMALAADKGLRVDIHCDETDDDHSRFVEVMAAETVRLGMGGRVTASHTTAMHSYNAAYAYRLINNLKRARMHMVTNPLDNSVLQGRFDAYPIRRGHTRVKELLAAGVNVCVGHDSVMDPWYPLGYGDPLQAAFVLAHYGQMSGHSELRTLIDMITFNPASALGLEEYGLLPGSRADLCAFAAPTEMDAIRLVAPRKLVLRAGKVVARTEPPDTSCSIQAGSARPRSCSRTVRPCSRARPDSSPATTSRRFTKATTSWRRWDTGSCGKALRRSPSPNSRDAAPDRHRAVSLPREVQPGRRRNNPTLCNRCDEMRQRSGRRMDARGGDVSAQ